MHGLFVLGQDGKCGGGDELCLGTTTGPGQYRTELRLVGMDPSFMELLDHPYMSQAKLSQLFPDQVYILVRGSFLLSVGLGVRRVRKIWTFVFLFLYFLSYRRESKTV